MPQIFPRQANALTAAALILAACAVVGVTVALGALARSDYLTDMGKHVEQPVPFSHEHHVGGLGINCRYCHTSVENSSFAGLPPTHTCMTCHSQLWTNAPMLAPIRRSLRENQPIHWRRVHNLADYVYFNHSAHVNNGIGCESCHGRVDQMPLMQQVRTLKMQWCLDCHRQPERQLRPREHIFDMGWQPSEDQLALGRRLVKAYGIHTESLTDCYICHR